MRLCRGNIPWLVVFLGLVTVAQLGWVLARSPVARIDEISKEPDILLQGRDPGIPQPPAPGEEQANGEADSGPGTVQEIGAGAKPVLGGGVGHGEGQPEPEPLQGLGFRVNVPTPDADQEPAIRRALEIQNLLFGLVRLEDDPDPELRLTAAQAKALIPVITEWDTMCNAVPRAQSTIFKTLDTKQVSTIRKALTQRRLKDPAFMKRPGQLNAMVRATLDMIKER